MHLLTIYCQLLISLRAGCGYGDFLVWTGSPVTPYDDLLYEHNVNFPNNAGYEDTPFKVSALSFHNNKVVGFVSLPS